MARVETVLSNSQSGELLPCSSMDASRLLLGPAQWEED